MFNLKAIRSLGLPVRFLSGPKADHIDINDIETIPNLPFLPFSLSSTSLPCKIHNYSSSFRSSRELT